MTILGIDHANLSGTPDLIARCHAFYTEIVGLSDGPRPPFRSQGFWLYAGDRPVVHLSEKPGALTGSTGSFDHLAFRCKELPELIARLDRHQIPFRTSHVPAGGVTQIFLKDPAGVQLELNFVDESCPGSGFPAPEVC